MATRKPLVVVLRQYCKAAGILALRFVVFKALLVDIFLRKLVHWIEHHLWITYFNLDICLDNQFL